MKSKPDESPRDVLVRAWFEACATGDYRVASALLAKIQRLDEEQEGG